MADTLTDNFKLTKIEQRKGWAGAMNNNIDRLGNLFVEDNAGNFWVVRNAIYTHATNEWVRKSNSLGASAICMTTGGAMNFYKCGSGTGTIVWQNGIQVSNIVADGNLDMGGFGIRADGIKTDRIEERVPGGSVDYDNQLKIKADSFVPVASDRVRVSSPGVVDSDKLTQIVVGNATVPAYYEPGTVRVGAELELTSTAYAHTLYLHVNVNGALSTILQGANEVGAGYVSVSTDIAVVAGDVIQVKFSGTAYSVGTCKNVFIGCDDIDTPAIAVRNAVWP